MEKISCKAALEIIKQPTQDLKELRLYLSEQHKDISIRQTFKKQKKKNQIRNISYRGDNNEMMKINRKTSNLISNIKSRNRNGTIIIKQYSNSKR